MRIALIDNYDSFTNNILHALWRCGAVVRVVKNDEMTLADLRALDVDGFVLSPGPGHAGTPRDVGVMPALLREETRPILGVCLGHQAMVLAEGGRVGKSAMPVHGEGWRIDHSGQGLFEGLAQPLGAVRYHSWVAEDPIPPCFAVDARTPEGEVMAVRHLHKPRFGLQFHPESIDTAAGQALIAAFLRHVGASDRPGPSIPSSRAGATRPAPRPSLKAVSSRFRTRAEGAHLFAGWAAGTHEAVLLDGARADQAGRRISILARAEDPGNAVLRYDAETRVLSAQEGSRREERTGDLSALLREWLAFDPPPLGDLPLPFKGGLVGYVGYEGRRAFGWPVRRSGEGKGGAPDAAFLYVRSFVVIDEEAREAFAVALYEDGQRDAAAAFCEGAKAALSARVLKAQGHRLDPSAEKVSFSWRHSPDVYKAKIAECRALIEAGESYELCLTNRLSTKAEAAPWDVYEALRRLNPAPYAAFLRLPGVTICSSSPERFFSLSEDGAIEAKPIKGTIARDASAAKDAAQAARLAASRKDRAENLMIADLLRHDIGAVAEPGSVNVPVLAGLESYETVHQMVSTVTGRARPGDDALSVLGALFPGGSMTGAPKKRTVELLDTLEEGPRGVYSGTLGWLSHGGAADMSIVIRSVIGTKDEWSVGCGGAITILSDETAEWEEILLKAATPMRAVALAVTGDPSGYEMRGGDEDDEESAR